MSSPTTPNIAPMLPILLGVIALAGVPLSSWLFIQSTMDAAIEERVARAEREAARELVALEHRHNRTASQLETVRDYAINLCAGIRASDAMFDCGSTYRSAYRNYQRLPASHYP